MIRKIIKINEDKCDGCGICVSACHEGAIGLVDGKAKLLRDDYCDGLGDCLPACPQEAITFVEREAAAYDEEAVRANMQKRGHEAVAGGCPGTHAMVIERDDNTDNEPDTLPCGCPGTLSKSIVREEEESKIQTEVVQTQNQAQSILQSGPVSMHSQLRQWPVQIKLVPVKAPYFEKANLLVAADCTAYAFGDFHTSYMKNKITLIGCPKLDEGDYSEKLTTILTENEIKSLMIIRMEVPCCGGLENAVKTALKNCGKMIPWQVVVISTDGKIIED